MLAVMCKSQKLLVRESGANTMTPEQRILFSEIYINNHPKLLRYAKSHKLCFDVAEELVQDTFHDAWSKFDELVNHENIGGWLMQTLKNKISNYVRSRQRDARIIAQRVDRAEDVATTDNFVDTLMAKSAISAIFKFVYDTFTKDDIIIFQRILIEGTSHKEVASELGITVWTSQKRLERIRKRIREEFPDF